MRLLTLSSDDKIVLTDDLPDNAVPPYAILSHRWEQDDQEVTFEDMVGDRGLNKRGYRKIMFCAQQAAKDGLQYFWVDSCCIDKSKHGEHQHAMQSMFRWYRCARRCYVYLFDVTAHPSSGSSGSQWLAQFQKSQWFTRGWTLQELLAPAFVEFFSRDGLPLGDKQSLLEPIRQQTGIQVGALQGQRLSKFTEKQRFDWIERRETTVEEDMAYSLQGIFGVSVSVRYGEGKANAFRRLEDEIAKQRECVRDLYITDPRDDKTRIEATGGGLLGAAYHWILEHSHWKQWHDAQHRLLWILGDPGKGKTMLLCGLINELDKPKARPYQLSYFFCRADDSRIDNATAVLRGLLYLLVAEQPSLVSHIQQKREVTGKDLFDGVNAWIAVSEMFANILEDSSLHETVFVIDALDECTHGLEKLLDFIAKWSSHSSRTRWLVSSRDWPAIEKRLHHAAKTERIILESNAESITAAVGVYIDHKVRQLAKENHYDDEIREAVFQHLSTNADDTFLWVSLVYENLRLIEPWNVLSRLQDFPPTLNLLYARMLEQVVASDSVNVCKSILAVSAVVCRPITLQELPSLADLPERISRSPKILEQVIRRCGSLLAIREATIYFVHQSAKEYLLAQASTEILPKGLSDVHRQIFAKSMDVMMTTLQQDIYKTGDPGCSVEDIQTPVPDPLAPVRYSCVYWTDHAYQWMSSPVNTVTEFQEGYALDRFIRNHYLYWLEALSLSGNMPNGVLGLERLESLVRNQSNNSALHELLQDAYRFIMYNKPAIEHSPLQAYVSALLFTPSNSIIKRSFSHLEPEWIAVSAQVPAAWGACIQTFVSHAPAVYSVALSPDGGMVAAGFQDGTVRLWDAKTGTALATLNGHSDHVTSLAFLQHSKRIVSCSWDNTVILWDAETGTSLTKHEFSWPEFSVLKLSSDGERIAVGGEDTLEIFDAQLGASMKSLGWPTYYISSIAFSTDGTQIASGSINGSITLWNAASGAMQTVLTDGPIVGNLKYISSLSFSLDGRRLASGSAARFIRHWDTRTGELLGTLARSVWARSLSFSPNDHRLAAGSDGGSILLWNAESGALLATLEGHTMAVKSITFSPNGDRIISGSFDGSVKLWNAVSSTTLAAADGSGSTRRLSIPLKDDLAASVRPHEQVPTRFFAKDDRRVFTVMALSPDCTRLVTGSETPFVELWDSHSGAKLARLVGHGGCIAAVDFSPDGRHLATGSIDNTIRLWETESGVPLSTLSGHSGYISTIKFSPDIGILASGSSWGDSSIKLWRTQSAEAIATLRGHLSTVTSIAFTQDGRRIVSGSHDSTVRIWDARTRTAQTILENGSSIVISVAFAPDGKRIAAGSSDKTVRIWDVGSGNVLQIFHSTASIHQLRFVRSGTGLRTDEEVIPLTSVSAELEEVDHATCSLRDQWIFLGKRRLLWLPAEYGAAQTVFKENMLAMAHDSGNVSFFWFDISKLP